MASLIDAGPIIAYYDSADRWHSLVCRFFETCSEQFITTAPCITEALFMLRADYRVQNELLLDLSKRLYLVEPLLAEDFSRIAELNQKYKDMPGDFADLSLVVISERLNVFKIASLDSDFSIYKSGKRAFTLLLQK